MVNFPILLFFTVHLNKCSAGSGTLGLRGSSTWGTASRLVKRRNTNLTIHINTNIFMTYLLDAGKQKTRSGYCTTGLFTWMRLRSNLRSWSCYVYPALNIHYHYFIKDSVSSLTPRDTKKPRRSRRGLCCIKKMIYLSYGTRCPATGTIALRAKPAHLFAMWYDAEHCSCF